MPKILVLMLAITAASLEACASGSSSLEPENQPHVNLTDSVMQPWMVNAPSSIYRAQQAFSPPAGRTTKSPDGIYAAGFSSSFVLGYHDPNRRNRRPVCSTDAIGVNGITVDGSGDLVVPSAPAAGAGEVTVYQGPQLCGKSLGTFTDPYGVAADAATANAVTGTIVVANLFVSPSDPVGNLAICTLAKGCRKELTSSTITGKVAGVALAENGDCWAASENYDGNAGTLTYFKGCTGSGEAATGWQNASYGGLMIDKRGNLISIDISDSVLWVYKGCNPACTLLGGPFTLEGNSAYGGLNARGDRLALGDYENSQVDIYAYRSTKLTYLYSISSDLFPSDTVEGAAFSPSS
jgi:hypothetical protein